MAGATCALSPTLEEALQKERDNVLTDLNDQIEFIINHPNEASFNNNNPIPIHDLMQNKIYRITLDATADFRPFQNSHETSNNNNNNAINEAWRQAKQLSNDEERINLMKDALYSDKKEFLIKYSAKN